MAANPSSTALLHSARAPPHHTPPKVPSPRLAGIRRGKKKSKGNAKNKALPTPNPNAPAPARANTLFQLLRANPSPAPPHAPAMNHEKRDSPLTHQGGRSTPRPSSNAGSYSATNPLLKSPATAHPMPNPTAPRPQTSSRSLRSWVLASPSSHRTREGRSDRRAPAWKRA